MKINGSGTIFGQPSKTSKISFPGEPLPTCMRNSQLYSQPGEPVILAAQGPPPPPACGAWTSSSSRVCRLDLLLLPRVAPGPPPPPACGAWTSSSSSRVWRLDLLCARNLLYKQLQHRQLVILAAPAQATSYASSSGSGNQLYQQLQHRRPVILAAPAQATSSSSSSTGNQLY